MARAVDRLLSRGHGPACYGYGWSWAKRCLAAADAADATAARRKRHERAARLCDIRVATLGKSGTFEQYFNDLMRE